MRIREYRTLPSTGGMGGDHRNEVRVRDSEPGEEVPSGAVDREVVDDSTPLMDWTPKPRIPDGHLFNAPVIGGAGGNR